MSDTEIVSLRVECGALLDCPVWESHKRGKNWCSVIEIDPTSPGGLKRAFLQRAHGEYFYMLGDVKVGDAIEFAADYVTGAGKRQFKRVYGVVLEVTATELRFQKYSTGPAACRAGK